MLHKETVSKEMWKLLQKLMKDEILKDFTLVGGTALSLMLGHRLSIDIDLFTTKPFDENSILNYCANTYPVEVKISLKIHCFCKYPKSRSISLPISTNGNCLQ